ncbi:MAG: T9SS type A sorting domain-containing protein, partial [candidate division WOR-3 bacterium]
PLIDGIIMDNEWNDAEKIDISDFLAKDNKRNVEKAFAFFKNSDSIFYIGIILEDFTSGNDIINIIFDDNADGSFPSYPDSTEGEIKFQEVQGIFSLSYRPYYSNHSAGSWKIISLPFGADFTNSKRSYEIGIPIRHKNFALPEEIGVSSSTDTFGIFIRVRDGSSFDYIGWWPQDLPFSSYNNPSLYAKIKVEDININIEETKFLKEFSFLIKKEKDFYRIILKFPESTEYELKLFDISGRNLWSFCGKKKNFEGKLFFKDFSKGVYFLKVTSGNINKIKKIVFY